MLASVHYGTCFRSDDHWRLARHNTNINATLMLARFRIGCVTPHDNRLRRMNSVAKSSRQLLSVAPMMDWTDVHYRQLARFISKRTWLYTEMVRETCHAAGPRVHACNHVPALQPKVVDKTILHTPVLDRFLWFPPEQHPIVCQVHASARCARRGSPDALQSIISIRYSLRYVHLRCTQLGGSDPQTLAAAVAKVVAYGYDEINLNCGCPSDRVAGAGCFGAALMLQPELVASCMKAMAEASNGTPVTVKCRWAMPPRIPGAACFKAGKDSLPLRPLLMHAGWEWTKWTATSSSRHL